MEAKWVLQAVSRSSASAIYSSQTVNLKDYSYLNWRWRIDSRLDTGNEKVKSSDDYAACVPANQ
ncbi:MAG: DUF3047 domain-containing protein [Arenicellales bacterium]